MKTLSPPDNIYVHVHFTLDPVGVVKPKLRNIIEKNYGFRVKDTSSVLKISLVSSIRGFKGLVKRVNSMFEGIEQYGVKVCLDHYVKVKNSDCVCREPFRHGNKAFCVERINDEKIIHIYCNEERREVVIRFFKIKPKGAVDLVLVPRSLFIECGDVDYIVKNLNEKVVENIKLLIDRIKESVV